MPNDEELNLKFTKAILEHLQSMQDPDYCGDPMIKLLSAAVNYKDNEDEQDVVLCDDDGESTIIRVRESIGYHILEFDEAWASEEWWENNSFVLPEDVLLAVAHNYLQQANLPVKTEFADRNEARRVIGDSLKKCIAERRQNIDAGKGGG